MNEDRIRIFAKTIEIFQVCFYEFPANDTLKYILEKFCAEEVTDFFNDSSWKIITSGEFIPIEILDVELEPKFSSAFSPSIYYIKKSLFLSILYIIVFNQVSVQT